MTEQKHTDPLEELRDKVKNVRMVMLTTISEGKIISRPMATQEMGQDGTIYFLTSVDSNKVKEIEKDSNIGLAYSKSSSETYISISGTAKITNNRTLIKEFWNPFYKAWFEGPEDPLIRVIEITPVSAEYWDTKGGKITSLLSMAASAITGKDMEVGENKEINL